MTIKPGYVIPKFNPENCNSSPAPLKPGVVVLPTTVQPELGNSTSRKNLKICIVFQFFGLLERAIVVSKFYQKNLKVAVVAVFGALCRIVSTSLSEKNIES